MRSDMFEVIIERPRYRCGLVKAKRGGERTERAFERAPTRMGMGMGRGTKYLNENLAPLLRFLRRRLGKPWARVSSEICASLSMTSAVQKHVMDHARQLVEENPVIIDGRPHHPAAMGGKYRALSGHSRWSAFYVCPKTGLLRQAPVVPRKKKSAVAA